MQEDRLIPYLNSLEQPESPFLSALRAEAVKDGVPIVRSETAALLRFLVYLKKPLKILEVGCAVAYSTILMAECAPEAEITTMEKFEKRIPIARENIKLSGMEDRITLHEGDATEILRSLTGTYDLIFMDAAKAQYIVWLPELVRLSHKDTMIISDNCLQDGDVIESRFAVTRRDRTIYKRMREYLYTLKHTDGLRTQILNTGDGIAMTVVEDREAALRLLAPQTESDREGGQTGGETE